MEGKTVELDSTWVVGRALGDPAGFGKVFEASGNSVAAIKFIPQSPGAERELLLAGVVEGAPNVVPIIDSGEFEDHWVLVMPLADSSLRQYLESQPDQPDTAEALAILSDICSGLVGIGSEVVHRDLKPENVLLIEGSWSLADFGISRYVEAATATETWKSYLSAPYAAPERWRMETATQATDIYSFGVIAYELLTGRQPFAGPAIDNYRDQHLHADPPDFSFPSASLESLVLECLVKAPGARPGAENAQVRLQRAAKGPRLAGLAQLQEANREEVRRISDRERAESQARTDVAQRNDLAAAAEQILRAVSLEVAEAIGESATAASRGQGRSEAAVALNLGNASLMLTSAKQCGPQPWGGWQEEAPAFDVISSAEIAVRIPENRTGYTGRAHSLWFGDIQNEGEYGWYEVAFMTSAFSGTQSTVSPFSLAPGEEAAKAVWHGIAEFQPARPFTRLVPGEIDDFIDRWASTLAQGAQGTLSHPTRLPEAPYEGSWRRT